MSSKVQLQIAAKEAESVAAKVCESYTPEAEVFETFANGGYALDALSIVKFEAPLTQVAGLQGEWPKVDSNSESARALSKLDASRKEVFKQLTVSSEREVWAFAS